jgi:hypothetical protein
MESRYYFAHFFAHQSFPERRPSIRATGRSWEESVDGPAWVGIWGADLVAPVEAVRKPFILDPRIHFLLVNGRRPLGRHTGGPGRCPS